MVAPDRILPLDAARVLMTTTCPTCQGEGNRLRQGELSFSDAAARQAIVFDQCRQCDGTGRIQLEISLEQLRHLVSESSDSET